MRSRIFILVALAVTAGMIYTFASAQNRPALPVAHDEQGIQKATQMYTDAFNKGDLDGILAAWAPDAEYIDETGKSAKGREAIGEYLKAILKETKGAKMQIKTNALRFVKDDVALQDGSAVLTEMNKEVDNSPFSAVWVKKEGRWLLQLVRDLSSQPAPAEENAVATQATLKDLAWLVGDWTTQDKETKTIVTAHWMKGDKFLVLDYSIMGKDAEILWLTQIIGWDPTGQRLHSWVFDSKGGFGEGYWSRRENVWTVEVAGVTTDGRHGSGTHKFTNIDANTFSFEGLDRELDGQPIPNVKVTYQRINKAK